METFGTALGSRRVISTQGYLDIFDFARSPLDWAPRNLCQEEQVIVAQGNLCLFWGEGKGGSDFFSDFFRRGRL